MARITAKHRTGKAPNGEPLRATFDETAWVLKWQHSGEWLFISRQQNKTSGVGIMAPPTASPKKTTIKKGCCGKK